MKRGEVWWAEHTQLGGHRPVVLISRNEAYAVRNLVVVAPVTTRIRRIPAEVPLGPEDGLPRKCVVNTDTIATIPKSVLSESIVALSFSKMQAVDSALRYSLGLDNES